MLLSLFQIFSPVLCQLYWHAVSNGISDAIYKKALIALSELCDIRTDAKGNVRPICQLITEQVTVEY